MEHSPLFLQNQKKIRFQVWNFEKFQTWNRISLNFFNKSLECSKINEIYLLWNVSELVLSKIRIQWDSFVKFSVGKKERKKKRKERKMKERKERTEGALYPYLRRPLPKQPHASVVMSERPTAKKVLWFCWKFTQIKLKVNKFR